MFQGLLPFSIDKNYAVLEKLKASVCIVISCFYLQAQVKPFA